VILGRLQYTQDIANLTAIAIRQTQPQVLWQSIATMARELISKADLQLYDCAGGLFPRYSDAAARFPVSLALPITGSLYSLLGIEDNWL